ncbi:hypothetical protein L1987_20222 [Smallanthus sonchifolius]|uniref:Uncharacterized protein n=1 Tax=Smallanthus sonchifolius TaxID=185202 RepID=A0ACB9IT22_9ASTR|nr:hypothetical protein L1987_20222 [Smallanthus sonchifolius]
MIVPPSNVSCRRRGDELSQNLGYHFQTKREFGICRPSPRSPYKIYSSIGFPPTNRKKKTIKRRNQRRESG